MHATLLRRALIASSSGVWRGLGIGTGVTRSPSSSYRRRAVMSSKTPLSSPPLLERIRALDRSAELSERYIPLVLLHPQVQKLNSNGGAPEGNSSPYVAVGHAERSLISSTLIHCKSEDGDPIFVRDRLSNERGDTTEVLRLYLDEHIAAKEDPHRYDHTELFERRTAAFDCVTNHLISSGVISRKHSDLYPLFPVANQPAMCNSSDDRNTSEGVVLAHINRNTAPYLGIDSVGVHLHCYVCQEGNGAGSKAVCNDSKGSQLEGLWLAKRAMTKSHHAGYWDPTVAGGHPANMSLVDNIRKEAHEEAGVPAEWIGQHSSASGTLFTDHTHDPLTITTAKPDGTCMKRSLYYSCDLCVPKDWTPTPVDGEVSEFKLYSMHELEEELRYGNSVRPAMRAVLVDFMMRHGVLKGVESPEDLRYAMRRERLMLW